MGLKNDIMIANPSASDCIKEFPNLPSDSGQSGLTLQLFPVETIVTSNLIGQNDPINQ